MKKTKQLTFAGLAVALSAVVVACIKLPSLPNGGCVTLGSMLVICLVGYFYGWKMGVMAGVAAGLIQFVLEPFVVHPAQFLLDYPLAFGALGLSGLFYQKKNGLIKGYLAGIFGRLFFHEISGLIFFTSYVGGIAGNAAVVWGTLLYNASYVLVEGGVTLIFLAIPGVRKAIEQIKRMAIG